MEICKGEGSLQPTLFEVQAISSSDFEMFETN
jgi:hypothetical protein